MAVAGEPSDDILAQAEAGPTAVRGGATRVVGYGLSVLISLGTATLLVRHLGIVDFGRYVTAVAVISIAIGLLEGGVMWMAVREFTLRSGEDRSALMRDLAGLRIALAALAALVALLFAVVAGYDGTLLAATAVATVGVSLQALQPLTSVPLQTGLRWAALTVIDLGAQVTRFLVILALVIAGAGLVPLLAASIPAGLVSLGTTWWLARDKLPPRPAFNLARWRSLIREQLPFAAVIAVGSVYLRLTVVALQLVASAVQIGYFATSYRVIEVLALVPGLLIGAIFPILTRSARDNADRHGYVVQQALEVSLIGGVLISIGVVLGAPFIIQVIAGNRAAASVGVLQILGVVLTGTFVAEAMGFALLSLRRYGTLLRASVTALVANVVLTLVLGSSTGARGAAVSVAAIQVLLAAQLVSSACRAVGGVHVPGRLLLALPLAAGAGLASAALPIPSVFQAALGLAAYGSVLAATGTIPDGALNVGRGTLRRRAAP